MNPRYNVWEHSAQVRDLYARRARGEAEEMTCARQCAEILADLARPGMRLLDAGCGSGYYYWSFARTGVRADYHGIDSAPTLIAIGRQHLLPRAGLPEDRLQPTAIEDLEERFDIVVCFNTLAFLPNYHCYLERLCNAADRYLVIRDSLADTPTYRYEVDGHLDPEYNHLRLYFNTYPLQEYVAFIEECGFKVTRIRDRRAQDGVELCVGRPLAWKILLSERVQP